MIDLDALEAASAGRVQVAAQWSTVRPHMAAGLTAADELHTMVKAAVAELRLARAVVEALRVFQDDIEEDRTETMHTVCTDDARNRSLRKYALKKLAKLRAQTAARVEARASLGGSTAQTGANKQRAAQ